MKRKLSNYFRDPHSWPVLISLLVSIFSVGLTVYFNHQQNLRFAELDQPRINLISSELIVFSDLDPDSALAKKWGYQPVIYSLAKNGIPRAYVCNELVFWDSNTNTRLLGHRIMLTLNEANAEAKRLKLSNPTIKKHLQYQFSFLNNGNSPASKVEIKIEAVNDKQAIPSSTFLDSAGEVPSGRILKPIGDLFVPLDFTISPEQIFRVTIDYEYAGKRKHKSIHVHHDTIRNLWNWRE
jgi:hypothetical protein